MALCLFYQSFQVDHLYFQTILLYYSPGIPTNSTVFFYPWKIHLFSQLLLYYCKIPTLLLLQEIINRGFLYSEKAQYAWVIVRVLSLVFFWKRKNAGWSKKNTKISMLILKKAFAKLKNISAKKKRKLSMGAMLIILIINNNSVNEK